VVAVTYSANGQPCLWWGVPWLTVIHVLVLIVVVVTVVSLVRWGYEADTAIGLVAMIGAVSLTITHRMLLAVYRLKQT
jgi:hypothetical protein